MKQIFVSISIFAKIEIDTKICFLCFMYFVWVLFNVQILYVGLTVSGIKDTLVCSLVCISPSLSRFLKYLYLLLKILKCLEATNAPKKKIEDSVNTAHVP